MQLRRYPKDYRQKPESVDSSEFIAFWADSKLVMAMDKQGVEWLLMGGFTLQKIEAGDDDVIRTHRGALVRINAVDRYMSRHYPDKTNPERYCTVHGREFPVSRGYKSNFEYTFQDQVSRHGFIRTAVAA